MAVVTHTPRTPPPMIQRSSSLSPLLELEARQDDVLRKLDELEQRVDRVLKQFNIVGESESETVRTPFRPEGATSPVGQ